MVRAQFTEISTVWKFNFTQFNNPCFSEYVINKDSTAPSHLTLALWKKTAPKHPLARELSSIWTSQKLYLHMSVMFRSLNLSSIWLFFLLLISSRAQWQLSQDFILTSGVGFYHRIFKKIILGTSYFTQLFDSKHPWPSRG